MCVFSFYNSQQYMFEHTKENIHFYNAYLRTDVKNEYVTS